MKFTVAYPAISLWGVGPFTPAQPGGRPVVLKMRVRVPFTPNPGSTDKK
ncbi:hypothetical protein GCM10023185_25940 [Hymenobacter saemangeumensis]|uniref:Uncharacterized protein n=1 Tax=Hymenobacter saemangeumensis TaxID=1084522 RepID=A0ABP8IIK8_9BACT